MSYQCIPGKFPQNRRGLLIAVKCFASHIVGSHYHTIYHAIFHFVQYNTNVAYNTASWMIGRHQVSKNPAQIIPKASPVMDWAHEELTSEKTRMWANAQRDGRPAAEYWWCLTVQCHKVWLTPTTRVPCSNAAKTRNLLKFAAVPQTCQQMWGASGPKFTIL